MDKKPIVFFSHSTRDRDQLVRLRELVLKKYSKSIEVFLSSDGESIPFGANWTQSVSEALQDARLMFVFLSPASLKSDWVLFETGHACGKGIKVVPVGINGIDIGTLRPPLSHLQGFNIRDCGSLANMLTTIDTVLDLEHATAFTTSQYESIFAVADTAVDSVFGRHASHVDFLHFNFEVPTDKPVDSNKKQAERDSLLSSAQPRMSKWLTEKGLDFYYDGRNTTFHLEGMSVTLLIRGDEFHREVWSCHVNSLLSKKAVPAVPTVFGGIPGDVEPKNIVIWFAPGVFSPFADHALGSALKHAGIAMQGQRMVCNGVRFEFVSRGQKPSTKPGGVRIVLEATGATIGEVDFLGIVGELFRGKILQVADG